MIGVAAIAFWWGYVAGSYGWVLIQGYDVPITGWLNPLHPFQWPPGGNPGYVRKGQIFPGGAPGTATTTTGTGSTTKVATPTPQPPAVGGGGAGR
jgi:hypothetical protein